RYACLQNPHLRPVNCGFSGCASLKLHLFIHLPENEAAKKYFLVSLFIAYCLSIMKSDKPAPELMPYSPFNHSRNSAIVGALDCTKTFVIPAGWLGVFFVVTL
ncbi:MAG: hypothetical protein IKB11_02370, partial [Bacteroidaceae bacterium]|nr:hypothetical protein [Bacteroidaceae bacterium]